MDPDQVRTFIDITGADEVEARHTLEAFEGDLNAAVNHYLEHGMAVSSHLQTPNDAGDAYFGRPGNDIPQNAYAGPAVLSDPPPSVPWRPEEFGSGGGQIGLIGGRTGPIVDEQMGARRARELVPTVSHPPDVQDVPIAWDDDNEPLEHKSSQGRLSLTAPRVEELPPDVEVGVPGNSSRAFYEEREDDEGLPSRIAPVRPVPFGNSVCSFREADGGGMGSDMEGRDYADYSMGSSLPVGEDEDMLRAAIEKSKEEAQEARRVNNPFAVASEARVRDEEDDDVARAMALSIETAKEERARREGGSQDNLVGGGDDMDGDFDHTKENVSQLHSGLAGNDEDLSARPPPATFNLDEEELTVEETEPLVRRRILGRRGGPSGRSVWPMPQQLDEAQRQSQISTERVGGQGTGTMEGTGLQDYSPEDELAGVSAEEQEEAKMIEAAMFGIPYVPRNGALQNASASANYQMPPGLAGHVGPMGDQFPLRSRGLGLGIYEDEDGDEGGFVRRRTPEPPSEAMIEQRLLREQQDDEYMASLTADREKEERAEIEKEVAKREAQAEEDRKREEALSALRESEELERKLKAKQESLPSEPPSDDSGAITLQVRMPDGSRRSRRFNKFDPLQALFDFVDVSGGVIPGSYRLVRTYPRRAFSEESGEETRSFEELGLSSSKQETLLLESI